MFEVATGKLEFKSLGLSLLKHEFILLQLLELGLA